MPNVFLITGRPENFCNRMTCIAVASGAKMTTFAPGAGTVNTEDYFYDYESCAAVGLIA